MTTKCESCLRPRSVALYALIDPDGDVVLHMWVCLECVGSGLMNPEFSLQAVPQEAVACDHKGPSGLSTLVFFPHRIPDAWLQWCQRCGAVRFLDDNAAAAEARGEELNVIYDWNAPSGL